MHNTPQYLELLNTEWVLKCGLFWMGLLLHSVICRGVEITSQVFCSAKHVKCAVEFFSAPSLDFFWILLFLSFFKSEHQQLAQ